MGAFWHPFADMGEVSESGEFVLHRGDGVWVFDENDRRYLDATAGLWFANVGHGRRELAEAAAEQMKKLAAYSSFGDFAVRTTLDLAERVASLAPLAGAKVFFTSGGSDSVDTAAKLARRYWHELGQPQRTVLVSRTNAYHGMHVAGTAMAGIPGNREGYGELMPDTAVVSRDSAEELRATIERIGPDRVAAFFCEPVIGAGGVYPPAEGYLTEVRRICREYGVLFVADEVVTGFGRIGGDWFASGRYNLDPDLITCAKGITSGYLPLGAVIAAGRVAEPFFRPGAGVWWRHGYTYSGHPAAAAVALRNLDILEREHLLTESKRLESTLVRELARLTEHSLVAEVRAGAGALAAVQLTEPTLAPNLVKALRKQAVSTRVVGAGAIQISPAFVMSDDEARLLADGIWAALTDLRRS
ncbi:aminotransferase family protein [Actinocatenispora rupis]|uniref:Aspartate aminotransferase family protein n=1 Tax=Actinocatenispora rupis TaxID=519421 RepID=A0A8J3J8E6_9ACTN|nr:aminotransferase class III-fold pyridoxal phosphate-dependent enzyme [Actinocatenispora rupis]GID13855.1 aspartate aminotransferase family protein [Actinocatenispora rupis]